SSFPTGSSDDLGPLAALAGAVHGVPEGMMILDRRPPGGGFRSMIGDRASVSARTWQLLGLPSHQVELVALRVGERSPADRRELGLVEPLGAQARQPPGLLVACLGEQDGP